MTESVLITLLVILLISVVPILVGAKLVGAGRSDFLWCIAALAVATVLHFFGTMVPVIGTLVAFLLAGVGFAWVLETSFLKGLLIHLVQLIFGAVFGFIASIAFGVAIIGAIGSAF